MEDLTPKIIRMNDSARFEPGGRVVQTTVVQFMLGRFGPYQHTFDGPPDRLELERVMADRRRSVEGLV